MLGRKNLEISNQSRKSSTSEHCAGLECSGSLGSTRLKRQIWEIIRDTTERSSIHGFPSFTSRLVHWFVKLIWLLCIGASWGYLIFQINNSFSLFYNYNVVSSTSIVYEAPTDFVGKKQS